MKDKIQLAASAISLAALLTYTLIHTGGLLARYIHPPFIGYVAAFGIELSIVGLSLRIGDMRKAKKNGRFLTAVLVSVVAVSAVANIAEGFYALQGEPMTAATIRLLDPIQAVIGLLATGLISLIVFALSEIIGTDITAAIRKAEREAARAEREVVASALPADLPKVAQTASEPASSLPEIAPKLATPQGLTQAQARVWQAANGDLQANQRELADALGISRSAVGQHINNIKAALNGAGDKN